MARKGRIFEQLDRLARMTPDVDADVDEGKLNRISSLLADLDNAQRDGVQGRTADAMKEIIQRLREDGGITPEDLALSRLSMVGDGEFYVQMWNYFAD